MRTVCNFLILSLGFWLSSCGAPPKPVNLNPQMSLAESKSDSHQLQGKILARMGQATLTDYKDYEVGPEDLLEVTFYGHDDLLREVRVDGGGDISLPLIGVVKVEGLSPRGIENRLKKLYVSGGYLINPQISVLVKEYRHQRVMVTGAVVQPGSYEIIGPRTLLEMLGKVGGLSDKAGEVVHVVRNQSAPDVSKSLKDRPQPSRETETIVIDLRRLLADGDMKLNIPIKSGDVINVPQAQSAYILGAVKRPGQVPIKGSMTVSKALALVEGTDPMFASDKISILRFGDQGERVTIPVNLGRIKSGQDPDPLLRENDVVFVAESSVKRLLFNIKYFMPGSFGFSYAPGL